MDDFLRSLEGPTVLVKVGTGDGGRDFTVSRALLCQNSEWFRSALEGDRFKEGQTGVISLPEDSTRAFSSFHFYLLRRRMLFPVEKLEDGTVDAFADQLETCIETWIFANKYSMHTLKDTAMIAFCWHLQHATGNVIGLPAACLALCFSHTGEGSPLRQLAADYIVTRMKGKKSDAGELVGDLAPLQGFIQALNEAHQFHHDAEEDTRRRYQRPREFIESLGTLRDGDEGVALAGSFTSSWTRYMITCHRCGYGFLTGTAKCLECRLPGKNCLGRCEMSSLCWECAEDNPTWDGSAEE